MIRKVTCMTKVQRLKLEVDENGCGVVRDGKSGYIFPPETVKSYGLKDGDVILICQKRNKIIIDFKESGYNEPDVVREYRAEVERLDAERKDKVASRKMSGKWIKLADGEWVQILKIMRDTLFTIDGRPIHREKVRWDTLRDSKPTPEED